MAQNGISLNDKLYVELVRSLYRSVTPPFIMAGAFALCFLLIQVREGNDIVLMIGVVGLVAVSLRLGFTLRYRRRALDDVLNRAEARWLERGFALFYSLFSITLGLFGGYVFSLPAPEGHMITICLLVGYAAGVATGVGLRPAIAIPNMMLAIIPAALVAIVRADPIYFGMALIARFSGGGRALGPHALCQCPHLDPQSAELQLSRTQRWADGAAQSVGAA